MIAFLLSLVLCFGQDSACCQDKPVPDESNKQPQLERKESPKVTEEAIRKLIRELDSNSLKDRDAAEKKLIELGPSISAFLPVVDANTSGEVKVRLQRIRQQMQTVDNEMFFDVSKVTLSGKMPLTKAIKQIEEQTGNKIMLEGEGAFGSTAVELDEKDSPFWAVMEKVMSQAKLRVNTFAASDGLSLSTGTDESSSVSTKPFSTGPFRIDVASVQSSLPFNSRLGGQLDLSLQVSWEPRLKPVFIQIPMSALKAKSNDERALVSSSPQSFPEVPLNSGGSSTQIDLQLERPARAASKLAVLSGEFVFAVPGAIHKYEFKKFGNGARQSEKFGEVSVTLEGARRNGPVFELRILAEFANTQGTQDSYRGWLLTNTAYLLDPKDRRLENVGWQTYAVTPNSVGTAYLFQVNGNPDEFKFVYESPGVITKQTVKFELQDIELP